jgi:tyrosine-protein phosphatase YwqE
LPFLNPPSAAARVQLGMDFHSHLLPGVDDGMADLGAAKAAILRLKLLGYAGAVLTPHIYQDFYYNTAASLRRRFQEFEAELAAYGVSFQLRLAAEYFIDDHLLELISRDELLWLAAGRERLVLVELPLYRESPYAQACLSGLVARGYRPVIAHVERYRTVRKKPQPWLDYFASFGAVLQGNIGSLAGQYGESVRAFAQDLRARNAITIWGTDLHNAADIDTYIRPALAACPHLIPRDNGFSNDSRPEFSLLRTQTS